MKKKPVKVPEEYLPYVKRGFAGSGMLFLAMLEEMKEMSSEDQANDFAKRVMVRAGSMAGRLMAKKVKPNDLTGFAEGYKGGFPNMEVIEESEKMFSIRCDFCGAYEVWKDMGLSDERIGKLSDIYCLRDVAFAEGFNPNIKLEFGSRIMKGDKHCVWNHAFVQRKD